MLWRNLFTPEVGDDVWGKLLGPIGEVVLQDMPAKKRQRRKAVAINPKQESAIDEEEQSDSLFAHSGEQGNAVSTHESNVARHGSSSVQVEEAKQKSNRSPLRLSTSEWTYSFHFDFFHAAIEKDKDWRDLLDPDFSQFDEFETAWKDLNPFLLLSKVPTRAEIHAQHRVLIESGCESQSFESGIKLGERLVGERLGMNLLRVATFYENLHDVVAKIVPWEEASLMESADVENEQADSDNDEELKAYIEAHEKQVSQYGKSLHEMNLRPRVSFVRSEESEDREGSDSLDSTYSSAGSAKQDKLEQYSEALLHSFLALFPHMGNFLRLDRSEYKGKIEFGTRKMTSRTDGFVLRQEAGTWQESKYEPLVILGLEAKRQSTSDTESKISKIDAQELGESIAILQGRERALFGMFRENGKRPPLTVYLLCINHRRVYIKKTTFEPKFMKQLSTGYLKEDCRVMVEQSKKFRLDRVQSRVEAARMVYCLLNQLEADVLAGRYDFER